MSTKCLVRAFIGLPSPVGGLMAQETPRRASVHSDCNPGDLLHTWVLRLVVRLLATLLGTSVQLLINAN